MKPYRVFLILFLIIASLGIIRQAGLRESEGQSISFYEAQTRRLFPATVSVNQISGEIPLFDIRNENNNVIGYSFFTNNKFPGVSGYGGPIHLAVGINQKGTINNIFILKHHETPGITDALPDFINRIKGHRLDSSLSLSKVDAISGATITSKAVITTINRAAQQILPLLSIKGEASDGNINNEHFPFLISGIILILFILATLARRTDNFILRGMHLVSGFIIIGLITRNMLSTTHIAGIVLGQFPSLSARPDIYLLLGGAFIGAFLFGRIYCSGICPFAFIEEILFFLNKKIFNKPLSPNRNTDNFCRWIKYVILITLLSVCVLLAFSGAAAVEVYLTFFNGSSMLIAWLLLITILVASFFYRRFWCKYLCPFGASLALFSQFTLFKKSPGLPYPCADPAECFYCRHCSAASVLKSTRFQNRFFISLIILCVIFLNVVTVSLLSAKNPELAEFTYPVTTLKSSTKVEDQLKKFEAAGISPSPAKYWKVIQDE